MPHLPPPPIIRHHPRIHRRHPPIIRPHHHTPSPRPPQRRPQPPPPNPRRQLIRIPLQHRYHPSPSLRQPSLNRLLIIHNHPSLTHPKPPPILYRTFPKS